MFPRQKLAIQIRGCFWHQHEKCGARRIPKSYVNYWHPKLERNARRDAEKDAALRAAGWRVLVVWGCELATEDGVTGSVGRVIECLHRSVGMELVVAAVGLEPTRAKLEAF